MFVRLLVPLDGTPEAAAALPAARTLALATGAAISLVRVISKRHDAAAHHERMIQQAEEELRVTAANITDTALRVDWLVRQAPIGEAIIQAGRDCDADVIAMATHGRTGLSRTLDGSVSERVLANADRAVLLVKPGGRRLDHVAKLLVPVDGTAGGALGLATAVGLARATGARLILLDVVTPIPRWVYDSEVGVGAMTYYDPAWEDEALHSAATYVRGLAERLRKAGLQVETRAVLGEVAPTIHAIADETDTDIVVMSTHALTGPARTVLGSVADAVVRTSHRPVLLVRRPHGPLDRSPDDAGEPTTTSSGVG